MIKKDEKIIESIKKELMTYKLRELIEELITVYDLRINSLETQVNKLLEELKKLRGENK